jgi:hypothetical protein
MANHSNQFICLVIFILIYNVSGTTLQLFGCFNGTVELPLNTPVDDCRFQDYFQNREVVAYHEALEFCGSGWHAYDFWDIQKRVAKWIVPLFLLIGSFQYAQFGLWNMMWVAYHIMADPITSCYNLLSKLASYQSMYDRSQDLKLYHDDDNLQESEYDAIKKDIRIILNAHEDWELFLLSLGYQQYPENEPAIQEKQSLAREMNAWLERMWGLVVQDLMVDDQAVRHRRIHAVQVAAKKLSDARLNGFEKSILGLLNYIAAMIFSLIDIIHGDFNNRTGHSMAFGVLWTWLLSIVALSCVVGGFKSKRSAGRILRELYTQFDHIADENIPPRATEPKNVHNQGDRPNHNSEPEISLTMPYVQVLDLEKNEAAKDEAEINTRRLADRLAGLSYPVSPSLFCPKDNQWMLAILSFIPVISATLFAVFISYLNPSRGFGCRSFQQLIYCFAWIVSAAISVGIRRYMSQKNQLKYTRLKDFFIGTAMAICFGLGYIGWFNSVYCWSAVMGKTKKSAVIVVDPNPIISKLARREWPALYFAALALQITFFVGVIVKFWKGSRFYRMSDEEHEEWCLRKVLGQM